MDIEDIKVIANQLPLMQGAKETILKLKKEGFIVCMITGGFDIVAKIIANRLNLNFYCERSKFLGLIP